MGHFTFQHTIPPPFLELADFTFGRIVLVRSPAFGALQSSYFQPVDFFHEIRVSTSDLVHRPIGQQRVGDSDIVGELGQDLRNFGI